MSIHDTVSHAFRQRRMRLFLRVAAGVPRPATLLDVGGTTDFWRSRVPAGFSVTVLNLFDQVPCEGVTTMVGDGCNLARFESGSYDVVFSNSVLCLVGGWERQQKMACEIRRVGRRYFVQTANRNFPLDWRTLVPMFHWLPVAAQAWCFRSFPVGRYHRAKDAAQALELATRVRDLTRRELGQLFPDGTIVAERVLGVAKSLIIYRGFGAVDNTRCAIPSPLAREAGPCCLGTARKSG